MGQVQSGDEAAAAASADQSHISAATQTASSPTDSALHQSSPQPSLDSLIAEAAAYGADGDNESLDEKAEKALECPCIAHLRSGPCGSQFSDAFLCFLKSTAEEKGSDCVQPFVALQNCIKTNPDAFSKDILVDDEASHKEEASKQDEIPTKQHKIIPPLWSAQSKGAKHKS